MADSHDILSIMEIGGHDTNRMLVLLHTLSMHKGHTARIYCINQSPRPRTVPVRAVNVRRQSERTAIALALTIMDSDVATIGQTTCRTRHIGAKQKVTERQEQALAEMRTLMTQHISKIQQRLEEHHHQYKSVAEAVTTLQEQKDRLQVEFTEQLHSLDRESCHRDEALATTLGEREQHMRSGLHEAFVKQAQSLSNLMSQHRKEADSVKRPNVCLRKGIICSTTNELRSIRSFDLQTLRLLDQEG